MLVVMRIRIKNKKYLILWFHYKLCSEHNLYHLSKCKYVCSLFLIILSLNLTNDTASPMIMHVILFFSLWMLGQVEWYYTSVLSGVI